MSMTAIGVREQVREPGCEPTSEPIRVFIVDNHEVVREGLAAVLARGGDFEIVGTARSGEEALQKLSSVRADVVLLDLHLPGMNGIEACRHIAEERLSVQPVILSALLDEESVQEALMAGARGYVVKDVEADHLRATIRSAARGQVTIDPKIASGLVRWAARLPLSNEPVLRPIECRITRLLGRGLSNKEIGQALGISPHTVKSHLIQVFDKLGAATRAEAVAIALRKGLI